MTPPHHRNSAYGNLTPFDCNVLDALQSIVDVFTREKCEEIYLRLKDLSGGAKQAEAIAWQHEQVMSLCEGMFDRALSPMYAPDGTLIPMGVEGVEFRPKEETLKDLRHFMAERLINMTYRNIKL